MEALWLIVGLAAGGGLGVAVTWMMMKGRARQAAEEAAGQWRSEHAVMEERLSSRLAEIERLNTEIEVLENRLQASADEVTQLKTSRQQLVTTLEQERKSAQEKLELVQQAEKTLKDTFARMSSEALKENSSEFVKFAKQTLETFQEGARGDLDKRKEAIASLVKPIRETLDKYETRIGEIEKQRKEAYGGLMNQVKSLHDAQGKLQQETIKLVSALSAPQARGRWGEVQLRRVVELAGMEEHCDFEEQASVNTEDGRLRPDLVVKLPGQQHIVIDAKAPLKSYMEAVETQDGDARKKLLKEHARHVRNHVNALSAKAYWNQFERTPEFVVLFLPGENFYSTALQQDPSLFQDAFGKNVLLTGPTMLIALLKSVAWGWRQEAMTRNAEKISNLGRELYERLSTLAEHFGKMGRSLTSAVSHYNSAIGSLERRVLVTARQFPELGTAGSKEIEPLEDIEQLPRQVHADELTEQVARKQLTAEPEDDIDEPETTTGEAD